MEKLQHKRKKEGIKWKIKTETANFIKHLLLLIIVLAKEDILKTKQNFKTQQMQNGSSILPS